jgi:uncharacterized protein (DUF2147 family)
MKIIVTLFLAGALSAQSANSIVGQWLTDDGERKIQISAQGDIFTGKIVWVKKAEMQSEVGKIVMTDLKFVNGSYDGGQFFMPTQKHSASCAAELEGSDGLKINIYHGIKLLGHAMRLKRVS